jgi:hypothetical protein
MASGLLPPTSFANSQIVAFSLYDGVNTIDQTNASFLVARFTTDADGTITEWAFDGRKFIDRRIRTCNTGTTISGGSDCLAGNDQIDRGSQTNSGTIFGQNFSTPGVWLTAAAPPPPSVPALGPVALALLVLMGTGVGGLGLRNLRT